MKKTILFLLYLSLYGRLFLSENQTIQAGELTPNIKIQVAQRLNCASYFREQNIQGSIIIFDRNKNLFYQDNNSRNETGFLPASTFKIFNSLVALETGVIKDELAILTWDGIKRDFDFWNRDYNMRQAIKYSAVWFYQVLARKIGHQRMQEYINKVGYGNRNIGLEKDLDRFWLSGKLRITPKEQINFLRRLYAGNLPFSERSMNIVKDILIVEQTPEYTLRAKTGWTTAPKPDLGWYVGYLEQNDNVYFFATNIDIVKPEDAKARLSITRRCLQDLGLFKQKNSAI